MGPVVAVSGDTHSGGGRHTARSINDLIPRYCGSERAMSLIELITGVESHEATLTVFNADRIRARRGTVEPLGA